MHTLHSELLLIAGHAIVVVVLGDEALGTNGLLAALAGEAGLMPAVALMLHLPGTCERDTGSGMDMCSCLCFYTLLYIPMQSQLGVCSCDSWSADFKCNMAICFFNYWRRLCRH